MKKKINILVACIIAFFIIACRQEVYLENPENYFDMTGNSSVEWSTIFEGFWTGMNTNYVFWDVDQTDWDLVYDIYKPKFEALGPVGDTISDSIADKVIGYFQKMCSDLVDARFNIYSFYFGGMADKGIDISPAYERYFKSFPDAGSYYQSDYYAETMDAMPMDNYFFRAIENSIDNDLYHIGGYLDVVTGYRKMANPYGAVLYLYFSVISWTKYFQSFYDAFPGGMNDARYLAIDNAIMSYYSITTASSKVREIVSGNNRGVSYYLAENYSEFGLSDSEWWNLIQTRCEIDHFNYFFDQLENGQLVDGTPVIGGIVDIRGNNGGDIEDLSTLWGRIVPHDWVFAKTKYKSGENRLDYTPPMDLTIFKAPLTKSVTDIPLVLVVNKKPSSFSELSALFFKSIPNGYVVGGTTWGGSGLEMTIAPTQFHAGTFYTGYNKLIEVNTSFAQILTLQGESLEGKGVEPDYFVPFVYSNMMARRDDRLEKAIEVILANR